MPEQVTIEERLTAIERELDELKRKALSERDGKS